MRVWLLALVFPLAFELPWPVCALTITLAIALSLGRIIGPIWAGFIFDVNINYPYISGSLFMLVGFFISLLWVKEQREVVVLEAG